MRIRIPSIYKTTLAIRIDVVYPIGIVVKALVCVACGHYIQSFLNV